MKTLSPIKSNIQLKLFEISPYILENLIYFIKIFNFLRFRSAVKEMEVMVINVMNSAFDTITYVEQGVEILDAFMHLSAREAIRRTIDKKTVEVYQLFMEDLNTVKRDITAKSVILDRMHPQYAGAALWAKGLKRRIEKYINQLLKLF